VNTLGLVMFMLAMLLIALTGIPVYAVLLGLATLFAALGVALGAFDWHLLAALPSRWVGLLEHDLLQALPLYAFIGALLNRLPLAGLLQRAAQRLFAPFGASAALGGLSVGALLAPMNGSVGASLHMLSRSLAPALTAQGVTPARATATLCTASTLGVVVPPSLVLLLLGDAMMRAHTEAANLTHAAGRIVNTQDVMRAVLLPGAAVLLIALALAAWQGRGRSPAVGPALARGETLTAIVVVGVIAAALAAVAIGRLYAVEAAACGGLLLLVGAAIGGRLDVKALVAVLDDTLALSGMLFALLIGATTFSLVLRAFGTDAMVAQALQSLGDRPTLLLAVVLGALVICSFVLDAFELIFLVVPIVMPPLLTTAGDAAWVATLALLVLQTGFLLPPFGYAVVMSRRLVVHAPTLATLGRALGPQILAQLVLLAAVLLWPQTTRLLRPVEAIQVTPPAGAGEPDALMQQAIEAQQRERAERP
jgi:TRAP-type mannitol/chloroaromatic compound transport system permease large subunit